MADDKEFQAKVERIGELVAELENIADAEARAGAKALVQLLLDLHAVGLERTLEVIAANLETGQQIIDDLGRDPFVSSLLILYGIHPLDLDSRILQAVERVQPQVRKGGGELDLVSSDGGVVRLRVRLAGHGCGSTGKTLKKIIEDALYEAAPDMVVLQVEGLEESAGSSGFVPLGKLGGMTAGAPVEQRASPGSADLGEEAGNLMVG
jgi:Fe-S cluster biogenesis protein NfuA